MRLVCPSCGALASLEAWANDAHARQAMAIMFKLPVEVAAHAPFYLGLFRSPEAKRGLHWKKAARLLGELDAKIKSGFVQRGRKPARPTTPGIWGQAMEKMVAFPPRSLPLEGHGYLEKIVWDEADALDRANEVARNKTERDGTFTRPEKIDRPSLDEMRAIRQAAMEKKKHGNNT